MTETPDTTSTSHKQNPVSSQATRAFNFQHAPPKWKALISFVDDHYKSLVNETGMLTYGFGPGPGLHPNNCVIDSAG